MGILDRFMGRRAAVTLAAPRPDQQPGPKPATDADVGEWGGKVDSFAGRRAQYLTPLLTERHLTARVIEAMRRHPQVSASLIVQALPMLRAETTIECDDPDIRDAVARQWQLIRLELMRSAAKALSFGYSPNVLVWDASAELGLYVRKVRDLDPTTCKPRVSRLGDYAGLVQHEGREGELILEGDVDVLQTLWLVEGMESGNLYGRSVLTAAREAWQEQQALNLFLLRGLERFGNPHVVTRAPDGRTVTNQAAINAAALAGETPPDPVYVDNLDTALAMGEGMRDNTVLALPSARTLSGDGKDIGWAWDVGFLEPTGSNADALREAIRDRDAAIARAILVPSLLLEGGDTVGSNALGQSHRDTFTENAQARLADYEAQLNRHLVARYVRLNFGENAPAARVRFAPLGDEELVRQWEAAKVLLSAGLLPVDAEAVAARVGLPLSDPEDGGDAANVAASPFSSVDLPALVEAGIISRDEARDLLGVEGEAPEPEPVGDQAVRREREHVTLAAADVTNVPDWRLPQSYDPPPFSREPTPRENLATFRRIEDGLNTAEAETLAALEELLGASSSRVIRQVEGIIRKGSTATDIVNALGTVVVGGMSPADGAGPFADAWVALQRNVWGIGLESVREQLERFAELIPGDINREGMALVRQYATTSARRVLTDLETRVQLELVAQYRAGVGRAGLTAAVAALYEAEAAGEGRALRLTTRTLSARSLNAGRADAIERGGVPLRGAQYSALLDRRTCDLCKRLDEQLIAIGDRDFEKFTAPVHHNCRCVWVYVTTEEADFAPTWQSPPRSLVERFGGLVAQ